jgi:transcription termination factor NusB
MMAEAERTPDAQPGADSRHRAREVALQMLYQWEVGRTPIDEVCQTFWTGGPAGAPPAESIRAFATSLASGVAAHSAQLDTLIVDAAEHWRSFSADESVRFINGILDAIRRTLNRE